MTGALRVVKCEGSYTNYTNLRNKRSVVMMRQKEKRTNLDLASKDNMLLLDEYEEIKKKI